MRTSDDLLAEMKQLHPLLIDLSLDRIVALLAKLGNPQDKLPPVIHVAGTNGKGSTTAFLTAILQAAELRVHVYTSPHLVRFHERIALAGPDGITRPIGEAELVSFLERVRAANAADPMTFFEITTAAAFVAFAEIPADAIILEVGLGGRLDATNVVTRPAVTVITPVAMDHADKLGATLEAIAGEKAGIVKRGVPVIVAQQEESARAIIEGVAARARAPMQFWGQDFEAIEQNGRLVFQREDQLLDLPLPGLVGRHQIVNAGTAVAAALELHDPAITPAAIERGLVEAVWPARMQRLATGPLPELAGPEAELWLDGGHNPAGGRAIAQTLADLDERAEKPVYLIVGMMGQKDAAGFLAPFAGIARRVLTVPVPVPGAHEPPHAAADLAEIAVRTGLAAEAADDVPAALARVRVMDPGPKRVLICGSLYLAGEVLSLQSGAKRQSN